MANVFCVWRIFKILTSKVCPRRSPICSGGCGQHFGKVFLNRSQQTTFGLSKRKSAQRRFPITRRGVFPVRIAAANLFWR